MQFIRLIVLWNGECLAEKEWVIIGLLQKNLTFEKESHFALIGSRVLGNESLDQSRTLLHSGRKVLSATAVKFHLRQPSSRAIQEVRSRAFESQEFGSEKREIRVLLI
jgi:hypothetical protein